jgi:hypothetical protein
MPLDLFLINSLGRFVTVTSTTGASERIALHFEFSTTNANAPDCEATYASTPTSSS